MRINGFSNLIRKKSMNSKEFVEIFANKTGLKYSTDQI